MLDRARRRSTSSRPGRVYRTDELDATHTPVFHQVEGLVVDGASPWRTCAARSTTSPAAMFGADARSPAGGRHYFPFTEPSAEFDVWFPEHRDGPRWVEWGGCGMVNPRVLRRLRHRPGASTPASRSAWASSATLQFRYGVGDMRDIVEGDVRFTRSVRDGGLTSCGSPLSLAGRVRRRARGNVRRGPRHRLRAAWASRSRRSTGREQVTGPARRRPGARDRGADRLQEADPLTARSTSAGATATRRRSSAAPRNFAVGDIVVVALPGGGAAGRLRDRRAQDVRPRLRRHRHPAHRGAGARPVAGGAGTGHGHARAHLVDVRRLRVADQLDLHPGAAPAGDPARRHGRLLRAGPRRPAGPSTAAAWPSASAT